jgi:hypothetical protein
MSTLLDAGLSGRVPVPPEQSFPIRHYILTTCCALLIAGAAHASSAAKDAALVLRAGKMELQFTGDGLLRNIRVASSSGWRTTAAAGSAVSSRRAGDWYVQCDGNTTWRKPGRVMKTGEALLLNCPGEDADLTVEWKPVFEDAFLITCRLTAKKDLKSADVGLEAFNLPPSAVKNVYCLPFSLPVIRDNNPKAPVGFVNNGVTFNNTFSLITAEETFSLSAIAPEERRTTIPDPQAAQDYQVGFKPSAHATNALEAMDGAICLVARQQQPIPRNGTVVRQFLFAATRNAPGVNATGGHIGQYMALVRYPHRTNLLEVYRKSMSHLLDNPSCFVNSPKSGKGYWGAIHSRTGEGYGNGRAFYAMYGSSFTIAALSQYAILNGLDPHAIERFEEGPTRLLTATPALTTDGAYWSMWNVDTLRLVDQADRPWLETHATGWIAYYLLETYQMGGDHRFLAAAERNVRWLASVQDPDGSFPKYFEDGKPSADKQGDLAWNALAFFKAHKLKIRVSGKDLLRQGVASVDWLMAGPVRTGNYYGAFEDVGGVTESYTSSVSARALMAAYRMTGKVEYLRAAKAALSVSLAWVTCDYVPVGIPKESWDLARAVQPAYGQVESVTCYYPCSYTLPMLYLAACEVAAASHGGERDYWLQIARQFSHLDVFLSDIPGTKARFGMEWRTAPFLVFPEWGNSQTCWTIMEALRCRAAMAVPELKISGRMQGMLEGRRVTAVAPKWDDAKGNLLDLDAEIDPLILLADDGTLYLLLLCEGREVQTTLAFHALADFLPAGKLELTDVEEKSSLGFFDGEQLRTGIAMVVSGHKLIRVTPAMRVAKAHYNEVTASIAQSQLPGTANRTTDTVPVAGAWRMWSPDGDIDRGR